MQFYLNNRPIDVPIQFKINLYISIRLQLILQFLRQSSKLVGNGHLPNKTLKSFEYTPTKVMCVRMYVYFKCDYYHPKLTEQ